MKIIWREALGKTGCPYVIRWAIVTRWFSVRLHHWLRSDDLRHPHDHAWWFWSFVLWGRVWDRTLGGDRERRWLSLSRFGPEHQHSVVVHRPAWTLLLTGPERREWGYWVDGKFRRRNKYFFEHGHHDPCGMNEDRDATHPQ